MRLVAVSLGLLLVAACGGDEPSSTPKIPESPLPLRLVEVASGLSSPMQMVAGPEPGALFVVEQEGRILTLRGSAPDPEPFLDIRDEVRSGGEQGLFALALHPGFPDDPRFYVHYSNRDGNTRVVEYRTADGGAVPFRELLAVEQPYPNHNGGQLAFGPDGLLYLGLGDGGAGFDPEGRSQNLATPLGKLLRLDVDHLGAEWEIAANGLRNPWRFSFDRETGDLWIGDVGQDRWEEVDFVAAGTPWPLNFGWDVYEGDEEVEDGALRGAGELVFPITAYAHDVGCSITGGFVYRGSDIPSLHGRYLYGDFCSGTVWSLRAEGGEAADLRRERVSVSNLTSFGEDGEGELYLVSQDGSVYRLAAG
jgi:glucose/arabinose dehydrogenase